MSGHTVRFSDVCYFLCEELHGQSYIQCTIALHLKMTFFQVTEIKFQWNLAALEKIEGEG